MLPLEVTTAHIRDGMGETAWFVEYDCIPNEERDDFKNRCFTDDDT